MRVSQIHISVTAAAVCTTGPSYIVARVMVRPGCASVLGYMGTVSLELLSGYWQPSWAGEHTFAGIY
jgi:hypothetical protein